MALYRNSFIDTVFTINKQIPTKCLPDGVIKTLTNFILKSDLELNTTTNQLVVINTKKIDYYFKISVSCYKSKIDDSSVIELKKVTNYSTSDEFLDAYNEMYNQPKN